MRDATRLRPGKTFTPAAPVRTPRRLTGVFVFCAAFWFAVAGANAESYCDSMRAAFAHVREAELVIAEIASICERSPALSTRVAQSNQAWQSRNLIALEGHGEIFRRFWRGSCRSEDFGFESFRNETGRRARANAGRIVEAIVNSFETSGKSAACGALLDEMDKLAFDIGASDPAILRFISDVREEYLDSRSKLEVAIEAHGIQRPVWSIGMARLDPGARNYVLGCAQKLDGVRVALQATEGVQAGGQGVLSIVVSPNGEFESIEAAKSAGSKAVDVAVVEAVRRVRSCGALPVPYFSKVQYATLVYAYSISQSVEVGKDAILISK